jgi:hypothetical protein
MENIVDIKENDIREQKFKINNQYFSLKNLGIKRIISIFATKCLPRFP